METFPVLKRILEKIEGSKSIFRSPTDMRINCAGFGIVDDKVVRKAAKQEVIRRYFRYSCEFAMGITDRDTVHKVELLMKELEINPQDRTVVVHARSAAQEAEQKGKGNEGIFCGAAIELYDGVIITGKNSTLIHAAASLILNAVKHLAGIPDEIHLLSPTIVESISNLKREILNTKTISLNLEETLIALSMGGTTNPTTATAMEKLKALKRCEIHMTHMPTPGDEAGLRKLGVNLKTDPNFSTTNLFIY